MAEVPRTKLKHITNTLWRNDIVCRILQNETERSFVKALKKNTILIIIIIIIILLLQLRCHSVAVVLTPVQTKQIIIIYINETIQQQYKQNPTQ